MEQNIFLEIEYLGTGYFGFQIQDKKNKKEVTVQEVLENVLKRLFREKIRVAFTSRTDRGVHAMAQGVNFKVVTDIPLKNIKRALNSFLPSDIRIKKIKTVSPNFHARFSALSKIYRYMVFCRKEPSVFQKDFSWHIDADLNVEKMAKAASKISGKKDFYVFAKDAKRYETCVRCVKKIVIKKKGATLSVDIEADGFLRSMARNIVAFLVKVGLGEITLKDIGGILAGRIKYTNKPAPAQGLYLIKVNYYE